LNVEKARAYLAEFVPSANSYRLNWSTIDYSSTNTNEPTTSAKSTLPPPIYVGVSIIASLIVLTAAIRGKRKQH
jgi:hypothetical protein